MIKRYDRTRCHACGLSVSMSVPVPCTGIHEKTPPREDCPAFSPGGVIPCPENVDLGKFIPVLDTAKNRIKGMQKPREPFGGSNDYYKIFVRNPTTLKTPYWAECNDIIESLGLTFAEANIIKAIWRIAQWRRGVQKKTKPLYDAEKVSFFAERIMVWAKDDKEEESKQLQQSEEEVE